MGFMKFLNSEELSILDHFSIKRKPLVVIAAISLHRAPFT